MNRTYGAPERAFETRAGFLCCRRRNTPGVIFPIAHDRNCLGRLPKGGL